MTAFLTSLSTFRPSSSSTDKAEVTAFRNGVRFLLSWFKSLTFSWGKNVRKSHSLIWVNKKVRNLDFSSMLTFAFLLKEELECESTKWENVFSVSLVCSRSSVERSSAKMCISRCTPIGENTGEVWHYSAVVVVIDQYVFWLVFGFRIRTKFDYFLNQKVLDIAMTITEQTTNLNLQHFQNLNFYRVGDQPLIHHLPRNGRPKIQKSNIGIGNFKNKNSKALTMKLNLKSENSE